MPSAYKTRPFNRWASKVGMTDAILMQAVAEMEAGLVDADLGGGVVKKRVPLSGRGKSGGARTIVATNREDRWFFLLGYEKSALDNIGNDVLHALQRAGANWLKLSDDRLAFYIGAGDLKEIKHEDC